MSSLPPAVLVTVLGLLLFTALLAALLYQMAFGERARLRKRVTAIVGTPGKQKVGRIAVQHKRRSLRLKDRDETKRKSYSQRLTEEIAQAGLSWTIRKYLGVSVVLAIVGGLAYQIAGLPPVGLLPTILTMGLGAPKFFLRFRRKRRVNQFIALFPDAIDMIVRGIKSGLPVGECISAIGREVPDPVGTEFRLLAESQRLGVSLEDALKRITDRVPNPELRFFAIVLLIQQQTGGNLAETLQKLSDVLRSRKKMREKIKAMSSEAKASAGIIGSLPFAVTALLSLVAWNYIQLLFFTSAGNAFIFAGFLIMGMGILVMKHMINFDI